MNQIIIKNLRIFAYHGVHIFEKKIGQNFYIDILVNIDKLSGFVTDKLDDTVSYSQIIKVIRNTVTGQKYNLIEKLAEVICEKLFLSFSNINNLEITVKKPDAPIKEDFEYVAIKIKRSRKDFE